MLAFEEALRKDRGCSAEKGTTKKGGGEQRYKVKRSPLPPRNETFTRSLAGQIVDEEGEVFAEGIIFQKINFQKFERIENKSLTN